MRSVDEHLARVLSVVSALSPFDLGLLDAHGCVLAEDVVAPSALPGFDSALVAGYAVRRDDLGTLPVTLPVVGDVATASTTALRVQPGMCVRITAGATVPSGADTVVPTEWTDGGVAHVRIDHAPDYGAWVRLAGEDVAAGATVLPDGTYLGAAQVGLAAAVGRSRLVVHPRPRVVVLATGSELAEPGEPLGPGRVPDSNSPSLTAAAIEAGAIAYRVGIVPDEPRRLLDTIEDQLVRADLVITTGGVSAGSFEVVQDVLSRLGDVDFTAIAMEPDLPQGFGTIGPDATPVFGLPGSPAAALVSFEVFVRPALRTMLGAPQVQRPRVSAITRMPMASPPGRRSFLRVHLDVRDGAYVVEPVGSAGTHALSGLAGANALAVVPEDVEHVPPGASVEVLVLERRGR
ncbi:MAG TPA: gephyrin-like molybdotransferase Glp [Mycobacteriales bacterium]|nr:gephyrin-like molybdotransferase Glp [Mycobacteriales bacterium]